MDSLDAVVLLFGVFLYSDIEEKNDFSIVILNMSPWQPR